MTTIDDEILSLRAQGLGRVKIAKKLGLTNGQVAGKLIRLNAHTDKRRPTTLDPMSPAVLEGHALFPNRVADPLTATDTAPILKPGAYSTKLGKMVSRGAWTGMPIYSLTLEERATCPRSCEHWRDCYGNHLHFSTRYAHGEGLEDQLAEELFALSHHHPAGFVVRLHVLGDFYSAEYVDVWRGFLWQFPALRVFGYTAWRPMTEIGAAVLALRADDARFQIRFSGVETMTLDDPSDKPDAVLICPVQQGKTKSCGTCALCWSTDRVIAFLRH